jgi:hypothetical protein
MCTLHSAFNKMCRRSHINTLHAWRIRNKGRSNEEDKNAVADRLYIIFSGRSQLGESDENTEKLANKV